MEDQVRIYRERIPSIASAIVRGLVKEELIEIEQGLQEEVELDIESVLKEYRRTDRELSERARDLVSIRNLDYSYTHKIKAQLAREKHFKLGLEAIDWITQQMLEILMQSRFVAEVFGEHNDLRRTIAPVLRKELGFEGNLDQEVKRRIKNLQEGTTDYDIEYQKTMERLRASKKLD